MNFLTPSDPVKIGQAVWIEDHYPYKKLARVTRITPAGWLKATLDDATKEVRTFLPTGDYFAERGRGTVLLAATPYPLSVFKVAHFRHDTCYDPVTGKDHCTGAIRRTDRLVAEDWEGTLVDILDLTQYPTWDRMYLALGLIADSAYRTILPYLERIQVDDEPDTHRRSAMKLAAFRNFLLTGDPYHERTV